MKPILTLAAIALLLQPLTSFAAHDGEGHSHDNVSVAQKSLENITVKPGEAVFEVHGIVCSFCAMGVRKKLSKLSFIDTSKYNNGVLLEIEDQKVTIAIKPGTELDVKAAYESIKSGGYEPAKVMVGGKDSTVTTYNAEGELCTATC